MKEQTIINPIKERRRRAARAFAWRVGLLVFLLVGVAYAAWLAPWARPVRHVELTGGTLKR